MNRDLESCLPAIIVFACLVFDAGGRRKTLKTKLFERALSVVPPQILYAQVDIGWTAKRRKIS